MFSGRRAGAADFEGIWLGCVLRKGFVSLRVINPFEKEVEKKSALYFLLLFQYFVIPVPPLDYVLSKTSPNPCHFAAKHEVPKTHPNFPKVRLHQKHRATPRKRRQNFLARYR